MLLSAKLKRVIRKSLRYAVVVAQYGCVTHCFLEYVADFVVCTGPSMEPTIFSHDMIVTEHVSPRLRKYNRGDIVVAKSPMNPEQNICKRLVALPGDKLKRGLCTEIVPRGHVWLEGDNGSNSTDSRNYGPVPEALIRGRVVCRVWPLRNFQMLTHSVKDCD